jgi:threonine dehydratase
MTATATNDLITVDDLNRAAALLQGIAVRTPLLPNDALSDVIGGAAFLKPEMLQRGGAFKFRGGYNFVANLDPAVRANGVIAPSSGNHAQAVALAAKLFGVPCTVVMPTTVTIPKRAGCERLGATVELAGTTTAERMDRAKEIAHQTGATLVPPYDDRLIIAGQGTAGVEIAEALPDVGTVVVPVGGGGLSAGVAAAVKLLCADVHVIAVEPEHAPKLTQARRAGKPTRIAKADSIADGLLAVQIGTLNFAHHEAYVDEVVTVTDDSILRAMRFLLDRAKLVAEPSGAITVAALLDGVALTRGKTVAVLSGGNVDAGLLAGIARRHETESGRRLVALTRIPDRPGGLATLLAAVAGTGANIVDVSHVREGLDLHVRETAVELVLETRGHEHAQSVLSTLHSEGYKAQVLR